MLTLGQQLVLLNLAQQIVERMKFALANKPISRISIRKGKSTEFKAVAQASGKSAKSLRFEVSDAGIIVYGEESILKIIYGEAPKGQTSFTSGDSDLFGIRQWMDDKKLDVGNHDANVVARLIQNKIQEHGSSIWIKHRGADSGVFADVLTEQIIQAFNDKFTIQIEEELIQDFAA